MPKKNRLSFKNVAATIGTVVSPIVLSWLMGVGGPEAVQAQQSSEVQNQQPNTTEISKEKSGDEAIPIGVDDLATLIRAQNISNIYTKPSDDTKIYLVSPNGTERSFRLRSDTEV